MSHGPSDCRSSRYHPFPGMTKLPSPTECVPKGNIVTRSSTHRRIGSVVKKKKKRACSSTSNFSCLQLLCLKKDTLPYYPFSRVTATNTVKRVQTASFTDFKQNRCASADWVQMARDSSKRRAVVNTVMHNQQKICQSPENQGSVRLCVVGSF